MKRANVLKLLACADSYRDGPFAPVAPADLRALCERWLAVEDAPRETVTLHPHYGPMVFAPSEAMVGKRVRIIPDAGKDADGG